MDRRVTVLALVESGRVDKPELVPSRDEMLLDLSDYALCWGADIIELDLTEDPAALLEMFAEECYADTRRLRDGTDILRAAAKALRDTGREAKGE